MARIVSYRTKHFEFRVPIDEWNEKKIPLPEGAGAQFIAPSNLTAILLEPFYYDWIYETDGRITDGPTLVYDEKWVGKEICHFPLCKELFEFLYWLKKEHGWYIFASWAPFCGAIRRHLASILPCYIDDRAVVLAFEKYYNLGYFGYVLGGILDLDGPGGNGDFWSASGVSAYYAYCLDFSFRSDGVIPECKNARCYAFSVRCVSEQSNS